MHTNNFLDPDTPTQAVDLVGFLRSGPGAPELCGVPDADASFGGQWATLAAETVVAR
ncbi:hypothetical protein [Amycolatopsis sp. GA6-003]|uniref:hypothetical protein n=1 Tax=Amycolatopsis sp. GA6-003 TaxID=2652444 RepID=UPI003916FDEF